MPINVGTIELCDLGNLMVGSQQAQAAYAGDQKTFPCAGTPPVTDDAFRATVITDAAVQTLQLPTVLGGSYDCLVAWGDGSSDTITSYNQAEVTHTYADAGTYDLVITGTFTHMDSNATWNQRVTAVSNLGSLGWLSFNTAFQGSAALTSFVAGDSDTSQVTTFKSMFSNANAMIYCDMTGLNTGSCTDFSFMFNSCNLPTLLGLKNWDVSAGTNFSDMFQSTKELLVLDLGGWDVREALNMTNMFTAMDLTNLGLTGWAPAKCTSFSDMFSNCSDLVAVGNLSSFDTSSGVQFFQMFRNCSKLTSIDLSAFNLNQATNIGYMFLGCAGLTSLQTTGPAWEMPLATVIQGAFQNCTGLTAADISSWKPVKCTNFSLLFEGCTALNSVSLGSFISTATALITGEAAFKDCPALASIDFSGWDLSSCSSLNCKSMFYDCFALTSCNISGLVKAPLHKDIELMFQNCALLTSYPDLRNIVPDASASPVNTWGTDAFKGSGLTQADYDPALVAWAALGSLPSGTEFNGGLAKYSESAARNTLTTTWSWVIADGGPA